MKILHTSDWHLGHRLHEQSQYEEQLMFLNWLEEHIHSQKIDVLLISGDVFDTGVPSNQSLKLYYDFLINLKKTNCSHIVITGGNHDAPGTLNAPKELLQALSIHVVGKAAEKIEEEVFHLNVNEENVIIAAVPYLRDQDIRRAIAGESFEDIDDRYKSALKNHFNEIAEYCQSIKPKNAAIIAMGHLFAIGGTTSESEQTIYVGNLGNIRASDFPPIFDYVALGHLHRPQVIDGNQHIRYSGSPYILSFSEVGQTKKLMVIETKNETINSIEEVAIPNFRKIHRISGNPDECIAQLHTIDSEKPALTQWVEVILDNSSNVGIGYTDIRKACEELDLEVLKVSLKNERNIAGLERLIDNNQQIKELTPLEVFNLKCKEQQFDIENNPEIKDAFFEILQTIQEQKNG